MTDYTELVKFLRGLSPWAFPDASNKRMQDAAAAIEALQAEVDTLKRTDSKRCQECLYLGQPVGEQLIPKRGKWIEDATTYAGPGLSNYKCSLCGKICGTWRRGLEPSELPNWCGNCGADMRAKMEVQE